LNKATSFAGYGFNADIHDRKGAGQKLQEDESGSSRDLQTPQAKESLQRALYDYRCPVALHEPLNEALDIVAAGGFDAIRS
jgi:hypothetical protein